MINRPLVNKKPDRYQRFSIEAAKNINDIRKKCPHFAALIKKLEHIQ